MKKIYYLFYLLLALSVASCYDDLGNYDYKDINDIEIDMPKSYFVKIPLTDSTLVTIPVRYTQVQYTSSDNLRYEWSMKKGDERDWTVCGHDSTLTFAIYPGDPSNIYLRVAVTDVNLGIVTYGEVTVVLQHAFDPCWFVLQDIDGRAVLGAADGKEGAVTVTQDVYKAYTKKEIQGKPLFLGMDVYHSVGDITSITPVDIPMLEVFTDDQILILDGGNLTEELYTYDRMLLNKLIKGDKNFQPWFATGEKNGECIIDNGEFWFAFDDGCSIYYPVKTADGSAYSATKACLSYFRGVKFVFDDLNKRFLTYQNDNVAGMWNTHKRINADKNYALYDPDNQIANGARLQPVGTSSYAENQFDPDNIGADKQLIYMGPVTDTEEPDILSVARDGSNVLYAYELSAKAIMGTTKEKAYCSGYWEIVPEEPIVGKDIYIASSAAFDRIFFLAIGNKIYRVDLNRSVPAMFEIYEAPEQMTVSNLRFRSDRVDVGYATDDMGPDDPLIMNEYPTWLGAVITDEAGNASIIDMKLNRAGDISIDADTKEKIVYRYDGFKNVVDFIYSFRV